MTSVVLNSFSEKFINFRDSQALALWINVKQWMFSRLEFKYYADVLHSGLTPPG